MPFINPFIKDGQIKFPDGASIVEHVERWARVRSDKLAYRFLDFSTERDGVARDLTWSQFSARNKARGRPACSRSPSPVTASPSCARRTSTTSSPSSARSTPDASRCRCSTRPSPDTSAACTRCWTTATRRPILTTTEAAEGVRKFFRSRPANQRPRVIAVDAVPDDVAATWVHPGGV